MFNNKIINISNAKFNFKLTLYFILLILFFHLNYNLCYAFNENVKQWTIMVYMNADNELDKFALSDILEMEKAGISNDVNVIVQIDRENLPARRYYVNPNNKRDDWGISSKLVEEIGEIDSGDYKELVKFVKWATLNYPALNYSLIIWSHGSGWKKSIKKPLFKGISYDNQTNNHISPKHLGIALSAIYGIIHKPLNVLAMDACLMQMFEVIYEVKDYVNYVVASEDNIPNNGFPYDLILDVIYRYPKIDELHFAKLICNSFYDYYNKLNASSVISLVDTSKVNDFKEALDKLSEILINKLPLDATLAQNIFNALTYVQKFYDYDNIDLGDFLNKFSNKSLDKEINEMIEYVKLIYSKLIVENKITGNLRNNATGIAIYFPLLDIDEKYYNLNLSQNSYWDELVKMVITVTNGMSPTDEEN